MKQYFYNYQTVVAFSEPVNEHSVKLRCVPQINNFQQVVKSEFVFPESFWQYEGVDGFCNSIIYGGTRESHRALAYASVGIVETSAYGMPVSEHSILIYALPTKMTSLTDDQNIDHVNLNGNVLHDACMICHWTHNWINYVPNCTNMETSAGEVYAQRYGVCQDYAHLMIAMCRKYGITARYVNGFLTGIGATHAWVEVTDGKYWYGFDPTHDIQIEYGYIKVAHGRDASDCPVSRGVYKGSALQQTTASVTVQEL